jgi:hypothetical protein
MGLPMFQIAWEQIMDLISSIKYAENGLGGRRPNQDRGKFVRKEISNETLDDANVPAVDNPVSAESDVLLGRKVDTTA